MELPVLREVNREARNYAVGVLWTAVLFVVWRPDSKEALLNPLQTLPNPAMWFLLIVGGVIVPYAVGVALAPLAPVLFFPISKRLTRPHHGMRSAFPVMVSVAVGEQLSAGRGASDNELLAVLEKTGYEGVHDCRRRLEDVFVLHTGLPVAILMALLTFPWASSRFSWGWSLGLALAVGTIVVALSVRSHLRARRQALGAVAAALFIRDVSLAQRTRQLMHEHQKNDAERLKNKKPWWKRRK